jgi:hypothetical protein
MILCLLCIGMAAFSQNIPTAPANEPAKNCDILYTSFGDTVRCNLTGKDGSKYYGTIWNYELNKAMPYSISQLYIEKMVLANNQELLNWKTTAHNRISNNPALYENSAARHLRNAQIFHFTGYAILVTGTGVALLSAPAAAPVIGIVTGLGYLIFDIAAWSAINKAGLRLFEVEERLSR